MTDRQTEERKKGKTVQVVLSATERNKAKQEGEHIKTGVIVVCIRRLGKVFRGKNK